MKQREVTWQSLTGALWISAVLSAAYVYIVLKLGMGPNMSVLAAVMGAPWLLVAARKTRGYNKLQNNVIQTAATAATSMAFMCVVAAAFGYLELNESIKQDIHVVITPWRMFWWLIVSGALGVLIASVFRSYFVDDPKMIFADGIASAKTIEMLDATKEQAGKQLPAFWWSAVASAALAFLRDALAKAPSLYFAARYRVGLEWSFLTFGTGMLVGIRVGLSMLAGTIVVWIFGSTVIDQAGLAIVKNMVSPEYWQQVLACANIPASSLSPEQTTVLKEHGSIMLRYITGDHFPITMLWFMWPATALMLTEALTTVLFQWRSIVGVFRNLSVRSSVVGYEVSMRAIFIWVILLTVALGILGHYFFMIPVWMTIAMVLGCIPLIIAGVRVLGETNNGPVSLMANAAQGGFRTVSGAVDLNLLAGGTSGAMNAMGEGITQCYKTGKLLGSTPRILTWVSVAAVPVGALAISVMYPILTAQYGLGVGLPAPTGLKLANMAILMAKGFSAFPPAALQWTIYAAVAGVVWAFCKRFGGWWWLPSAAGFGFGLILPGTMNMMIAAGGIFAWWWQRRAPESYARYNDIVASAFIAGEALIAALIVPLLATLGWI
ncbi:MAG: OPT/YSL family transporter [Patescibacteria group bacterium]